MVSGQKRDRDDVLHCVMNDADGYVSGYNEIIQCMSPCEIISVDSL